MKTFGDTEIFVLYNMTQEAIEILQSDDDNPFPFDDNGGEPDGPSWYVPLDQLDLDTVAALEANRLGYRSTATVLVDYDSDDADEMTEQFGYKWCGYSSREVAYGRND